MEVGVELPTGDPARSAMGTANASVTAPPTLMTGSSGIVGAGPLRRVPKRGNQSMTRCPGGSDAAAPDGDLVSSVSITMPLLSPTDGRSPTIGQSLG